jgi:hypothetical protein
VYLVKKNLAQVSVECCNKKASEDVINVNSEKNNDGAKRAFRGKPIFILSP